MFTFPLILLIHVFVLSSLCVFISVNVLFPISVRLLLRSTPLHWHSFKRSRKHDCHNINLLPGLIAASCRLSAALVVSLKQTKKKKRDAAETLLPRSWACSLQTRHFQIRSCARALKNNVTLHLLQRVTNRVTLQRGDEIRPRANNGRTSSTWAPLSGRSTRLFSGAGKDTATSYLLIIMS